MPKLKWRRVLRVLHRDLGFLCVGLTVVYAVSGIAVNHKKEWNYNLATTREVHHVGGPAALLDAAADADPGRLARDRQDELVAGLTRALGRPDAPRKAFWRGPEKLSLFFGEAARDVVDYDPTAGVATHEITTDRFLLRDFNALHLNEPASAWTWIADIFAILLIFLAISGLFIVKGKAGIVGRGAIYVGLGIAIPIIALVIWH